MLAVCIVHEHHRELERLRLVELHKAEDACGGLLTTSDDIRNEMGVFCMHKVDKVSSVIDDDVRSHFENPSDVLLIFMRCGIIPCEHIQARMHESGSDIVLGRKRVASGHIHLGSAGCEHLAEVRRLRLEMHREGYLQSLERERFSELFLESVKERHMMLHPVNFESSVLPKLRNSYFACHMIC